MTKKASPTTRPKAVIYARLSRDITGKGESVADQIADAHTLAEARGWDVIDEYRDGSITAAEEGKRPAYDALLKRAQAGGVDVIIGRAWDRMTRNRRDDLRLIESCEKNHILLSFTRGADIDLTTTQGQIFADTLAMIARAENREKSERLKRANLRRAMQGKAFVTVRPFGYEADGVTIREDEAAAIKDAYAHILNGGTVWEVTRQWNDAGFHTPKGNPWRPPGVTRYLRTHRPAGMRTYHGEVMRDEHGEPVTTEWPPIVDRDTWYAAQAILTDPGRVQRPHHASRLLLSGVAVCDVCGARIQSGGAKNGKQRYRCSAAATPGGTAHVYRFAEPVDDFVRKVLLARLMKKDPDVFAQDETDGVDPAQIRRQLAEVNQRRDQVAEAFADGLMNRSQLVAATKRLDEREKALEDSMPTPAQAPALSALLTARDVRAAWEDLTLDAQRGIIDALMDIRLLPPGRHGYVWEDGVRGVNPDTIDIEWKRV